ncbi:MAG: MFS transporter [Aphanothece sp. CMT-3BRIN-NPC111]|jgi:nucleoid DNA-binding protein|nr:MFS transporter [Aphanothece sp. CMT-3BRIN-NPC111]
MFQSGVSSLGLDRLPLWLAQVPGDGAVDTPEKAALVFSGPKFFVALIAGVVLAFAFQLVLTNLSVAFGISYLGHKSDSSSDSSDSSDSDDTGSIGGTIRKIGTAVGIWTLVTVTIALLVACFLAVKLSLITDRGLGAIIGLVIWGTYFSLLVWVSSTTVGSLIGSVVNTATSGFQAIMGTATAALGAKAASNQVVSTAEAAASAIRRELTAGFDPDGLRDKVEDYIQSLRPPELDIQGIRREFENILNDPQVKEIAATGGLANIDRQQLVDLVSSRTDLSKKDVNRIVDQLESVWKLAAGSVQQQQPDWMGELVNFLKSAQPDQLRQELTGKLDELISAVGSNKGGEQQGQSQGQSQGSSSLMDKAVQFGLNQITGGNRQGEGQGGSSMMNQAMMTAFNTILATVMGRTDLSDLDVQKILDQLRTAKDKVTQQGEKVITQVTGEEAPEVPEVPFSTVRADVENYLLNAYSWKMNPTTIAQEFKDVLYDPQADPGRVREELEQISRQNFVELLQQRGVFTQDKINEIADQLEGIRLEVLYTARVAEQQEKAQDLRMRVEAYLLLTKKEELTAEKIESDFKHILEDQDADYETLRDRFGQFDPDTLVQILNQRNDLTQEEREQIVNDLGGTLYRILTQSQDVATQAKAEAETLWLNLESYLHNTGKEELNPEGIKRDITQLLDDPQAGVWAIRARLSRFDRDTLVKLLSQRQDLSEEQVNQILDQVQNSWSSVLKTPQTVVTKAKEQYDQATSSLAEYLRSTGKEQLNPEGIKRDLTQLLNNPQGGATALRDRLSRMDRDTLVKLLSQRQDLSEDQINQVIDQVQNTIKAVIRAPRRLASRTQAKVQDFQSTLEDYLRNTGKDELNPEGIKRDLQLLLNDRRVGMESLSDRLSKIDRETLIALLSQRQDIPEEEATRIVDQVLSVRDQFVEQVRAVQRRIQSVVDGVFERIRNYLNSLNRPELNYDGIKKDIGQLFDDPQAGFDALRDRLGHFNRDTLVALMSSREDISEADANRLIDQIEGTRNNVLQRAERLQQEAQRRIKEVKEQAQKQAEETRKAAESASWWLLGTGVVSGLASAAAGALAVAPR